MASVETPYGRIQWKGLFEDLREGTEVTVIKEVNGSPITRVAPLSTIIAMTNGDIIQYLP